jgi:hypothetical protein
VNGVCPILRGMELWAALIGAAVGGAGTFAASMWGTRRVFAHEVNQARQQDARTAARDMLRESRAFLDAVAENATNRREHRVRRREACWSWLATLQVVQATLYAVTPALVGRFDTAATRIKDALQAAEEVGDEDDQTWVDRMEKAIKALTDPVFRLNTLLVGWIATGQVLDFDEAVDRSRDGQQPPTEAHLSGSVTPARDEGAATSIDMRDLIRLQRSEAQERRREQALRVSAWATAETDFPDTPRTHIVGRPGFAAVHVLNDSHAAISDVRVEVGYRHFDGEWRSLGETHDWPIVPPGEPVLAEFRQPHVRNLFRRGLPMPCQ